MILIQKIKLVFSPRIWGFCYEDATSMIHVHVTDNVSVTEAQPVQDPFSVEFSQPGNFLNVRFRLDKSKQLDCELLNSMGQQVMRINK